MIPIINIRIKFDEHRKSDGKQNKESRKNTSSLYFVYSRMTSD